MQVSARILCRPSGNRLVLPKPHYKLQFSKGQSQSQALQIPRATASAPGGFNRQASYQETSRKIKRTVYDHDLWAEHRSLLRWVVYVCRANRSTILRSIMLPVMFATAFSAAVCAYNMAFAKGLLHKALPALCIPQAFLNLPSFAISLLLVFRTNASYGRWDEARKMWGLMLNRSRDLMRQACTYFPPHALAAKKMLARWTVAMQKSLMHVCRPDVDLDAVMDKTLRPEEMEMLKKSPHKVVFSMHMMSEVITSVHVAPQFTMDMMTNVTTFHDILGGCERLLRTPIPLSYTRHTSRSLAVWLAALPMALWPTIGWAAVPVAAFMSILLLGIEEVGMQIEEPFGVLALEAIQKRAETDVWSHVEVSQESYEYVQDTLIREGALAEQGPPRVYSELSSQNGVRSSMNGSGKPVDYSTFAYEDN